MLAVQEGEVPSFLVSPQPRHTIVDGPAAAEVHPLMAKAAAAAEGAVQRVINLGLETTQQRMLTAQAAAAAVR